MINPHLQRVPQTPEPIRPKPAPPLQAPVAAPSALPPAAPLPTTGAQGKVLPSLSLGLETARSDWGDVTVAERKANLHQLQRLAHQLQAAHTPGIEIWSRLTQAATEAYAGKQLSAARKSDFVMQDLVVTVVGGDAFKHLQAYQQLPWVRHPDPLVQTFFDDWAALGLPPADHDWEAAGWAGSGLDQTHCSDFRSQIADGSDNQIYHTMFYHFMAYTTQAPFTIHGGSIVHEVKDAGTSSEDHNACFAGVTTGLALRRGRDSGAAADWLQDWPAITRAAYSRDGGPQIQAGTAGPRAQAANRAIRELLEHKPLLWKAENAAIDGVKYIKLAGDKISRLWK